MDEGWGGVSFGLGVTEEKVEREVIEDRPTITMESLREQPARTEIVRVQPREQAEYEILDAEEIPMVRVNQFHRACERAGNQFLRMVARDLERVIDEASR